MTTPPTLTSDPDRIAATIEAHLNSLDIDVARRLYHPHAIMIDAGGGVRRGVDAICTELEGYFRLGLPIAMTLRHLFVAGDTALLIMDWSMTGTAADGTAVDMHGTASDVVRRGADGLWRYLIDNPFGTQRRDG